MQYRPHRHCLLLGSRTHGTLAFNAKSSPGDIEEQVPRWLFCFCFYENSHVLCNICILHREHSQKHAPVVQGFVSVTMTSASTFQPLSASWGTSRPHSAHLLYFRSIRRFRPALCDLATQCMSSDAMLNALATDAVNLLWHRVRPFCVAE